MTRREKIEELKREIDACSECEGSGEAVVFNGRKIDRDRCNVCGPLIAQLAALEAEVSDE